VKSRRCHPTDLSDEEWTILKLLVPQAKPGGRPRTHQRRELLDAIFYVVRGGCAWSGGCCPTTFHPGKPPTTTFVCGASMVSGRGCMLLCGSEPVLGKVAKKPPPRLS
jgi:hypothetical protein